MFLLLVAYSEVRNFIILQNSLLNPLLNLMFTHRHIYFAWLQLSFKDQKPQVSISSPGLFLKSVDIHAHSARPLRFLKDPQTQHAPSSKTHGFSWPTRIPLFPISSHDTRLEVIIDSSFSLTPHILGVILTPKSLSQIHPLYLPPATILSHREYSKSLLNDLPAPIVTFFQFILPDPLPW